MNKRNIVSTEPTEADIQHQAYLLWLEGGSRFGGESDDWHAAKEILRHRHHAHAPVKIKSIRSAVPAATATR